MEIRTVDIRKKENQNIIIGQSHFIKTVEDLFEAMAQSSAGARFGLAFAEASGPRLVRTDGTDAALIKCAEQNCHNIAAGHVFVIVMEDMYPINCLNKIKAVPEVCSIFAATANDLKVVVVEEDGRRGVIGVIDGEPPIGTEENNDRDERRNLLRTIGYKR